VPPGTGRYRLTVQQAGQFYRSAYLCSGVVAATAGSARGGDDREGRWPIGRWPVRLEYEQSDRDKRDRYENDHYKGNNCDSVEDRFMARWATGSSRSSARFPLGLMAECQARRGHRVHRPRARPGVAIASHHGYLYVAKPIFVHKSANLLATATRPRGRLGRIRIPVALVEFGGPGRVGAGSRAGQRRDLGG
jgi:hypothetical protein